MSVELFANGVPQGVTKRKRAVFGYYTVDQTGTIELFAVATETLPIQHGNSPLGNRAPDRRSRPSTSSQRCASASQYSHLRQYSDPERNRW